MREIAMLLMKREHSKSTFVTSNLPSLKLEQNKNLSKATAITNGGLILPEIGNKNRSAFIGTTSSSSSSPYQKKRAEAGMSDYVELVKKNKKIRELFKRKLGQTLERQKKESGEQGKEYAKDVRERLRKCVKDQRNDFVRNVELLALMQKYCCQMQRFRNMMLSDIPGLSKKLQ